MLEGMSSGRRSPAVTTFAAMYAGGGLTGLLGVVFPLSEKTPVELDAAFSVVGIAIALGVWFAADRTPEWVLKAGLGLAILMVGVVVSQSATPQGLMLIAFTYVWMAIYIAVFFSRRATVATAVLISITFGAAIVANGMSNLFTCWLIASVTVAVAGLVLNHQSLRQRALAVTDPLTGLVNRNGLLQAAERELAISGRTGRSLTVAVMDLDDFKQVNDRHGHLAGDRVLADLARRWSATLRAGDVLARTGGDEFVLLLPATEEAAARPLLDRLRNAADIAWSVGSAELEPGEDFYDCMARADRALYGDKAARSTRSTPFRASLGSVATVEV
jgi:diguanylate cyclase (GGDEF)-like protein